MSTWSPKATPSATSTHLMRFIIASIRASILASIMASPLYKSSARRYDRSGGTTAPAVRPLRRYDGTDGEERIHHKLRPKNPDLGRRGGRRPEHLVNSMAAIKGYGQLTYRLSVHVGLILGGVRERVNQHGVFGPSRG